MSHWNYRVISSEGKFAVHEVYYEDDGKIHSWTAQPVLPESDSLEDLTEEFERYRRALTEPVLDKDELETGSGHMVSSLRQMTPEQARKALNFSDEWLTLGIVTPERIDQLTVELITGDDPNPEHYRYRAFREFLKVHRPLSHQRSEALYRLGDRDPDRAMGGAIMVDILYLKECPVSLRQMALTSEREHIVTTVQRWLIPQQG